MPKKEKQEFQGDPTGWMVTFGDLLMLLLTFFVMLLTMRSLETSSIRAMFNVGGLGGGFGALLFTESDSTTGMLLESGKQDALLVVSYKMLAKLMDQGEHAEVDESLGTKDAKQNDIEIYENQEGYVIGIQADVLFGSGQSQIKPHMFPALDRVAKILNAVSNDIIILGHTDNIAPDRSKYSSNWELSLYRALSVHKYFIENKEVAPERFSIGGCGSTRPLISGETIQGRKKNRRVEIILKRH